MPLPPEKAAEVARLAARIAARKRRLKSTARLTLGVLDSDNVNDYPERGVVTLLGRRFPYTSFDIDGRAHEQPLDDRAFTYHLALDTHIDTQAQRIDRVFFNLGLSGARNSDTGFLAYRAAHAGVGARVMFENGALVPTLSHSLIENDMRSLGDVAVTSLTLAGGRTLGADTRADGHLRHTRRAYESSRDFNDTSSRTATAGITHRINAVLSVGLSADVGRTDAARNRDLDRRSRGLTARARLFVRPHALFELTARAGRTDYAHVYSGSVGLDSAGVKREDDSRRAALAVFIGGDVLFEVLRDVQFYARYSYTDTQSNLPDYENDKTTIELALTYSFSL